MGVSSLSIVPGSRDAPGKGSGLSQRKKCRNLYDARWSFARRELWLALPLVTWFVLSQRPVEAQVQEIRRVLIINAWSATAPATARTDEAIQPVLEKSPYQIELYREYIETSLFPDVSSRQKFRESYVEKYRDRQPDLIIAVGLSAMRFMSESHERLFPDTPIVLCSGAEELAGDLKLGSQFVGVWMFVQPVKTLEIALALQPGTRHVVVVGGSGKHDKLGEATVREQFRRYEGKYELTYFTDLVMPILLERLKQLPSHTLMFYTSFSQDAAGTRFINATQSLPLITAAANAPVFVTVGTLIGQGTVGGYVNSFAEQGSVAGQIATRILSREKPRDIPIVRGTNLYMFDWRALHRWRIKESDLPPGSTALYRIPTLWEQHRRHIEMALLLFLGLTVFGTYFLSERMKRRRAEDSLVRRRRFETLISDISFDFTNLSASQRELGIQESLVRLREFLGVDRISIFELADKATSLRLRHSARTEATAAPPGVLSGADFPWLFAQLVGADPIVISQLDDLPDAAKRERELFRESNASTIVIFPLTVEYSLVGILNFVVTQDTGSWPRDLLPQLKVASQVYANAVARELDRKSLLESESRFKAMGDVAPTFIWVTDQDGNFIYLNKKTLDFTGAKEDHLSREEWSAYLHPDDLPAAIDRNVQAEERREAFIREYRCRRYDGVYRWMFDIANPRFTAEGSFLGFIGSAVDVTDQRLAKEALEKVGGQLIAAQEKERSYIARELHDDVCQRLAMISLRIEKLTKGWDTAPAPVGQQLEQIWQQCSELMGDVQALSHELHPSILENLGLVTAVKSFCREFAEQNDAVVEFSYARVSDSLPREVSLSLFRVVQETLHNAAKYSGVKQFEVNLEGKPHGIELDVSDRGVGFELASLKNIEGLGLVSMRERIHLLNGTISIESIPSVGTSIRAWIPLASTSSADFAHGVEIWR